MRHQHNPFFSSTDLGRRLREARLRSGKTIVGVESETGIDRGQISRFERGIFKRPSKNLQKLTAYLQIDLAVVNNEFLDDSELSLGARIKAYAAKSGRHASAVAAMILLLERLG